MCKFLAPRLWEIRSNYRCADIDSAFAAAKPRVWKSNRAEFGQPTVDFYSTRMSVAAATSTLTVALVGNPNTGKSTLFTALAGVRQRIGNYPGVTVEKKLGYLEHGGRKFSLVDLPGTYSLTPDRSTRWSSSMCC